MQALIENKKLLLIDDSIVRGTQLRETTEFLYQSGAKEVHVRPACPPLLYGCKYLNFSRSKSELDLITRRIIEEREEEVTPEILAEYADPTTERYDEMVEEIRKRQNLRVFGITVWTIWWRRSDFRHVNCVRIALTAKSVTDTAAEINNRK